LKLVWGGRREGACFLEVYEWMLVRGMRWDEQTILRSLGPWRTLALISVLEVVLDMVI